MDVGQQTQGLDNFLKRYCLEEFVFHFRGKRNARALDFLTAAFRENLCKANGCAPEEYVVNRTWVTFEI